MGHHGEGVCPLCDKEERQKTRMTQRDYLKNFLPFFNKMAQIMADNFKEKGHSWKTDCTEAYLLDRMAVQFEDMQNDPDREDYYANIANYCAMLWFSARARGRKGLMSLVDCKQCEELSTNIPWGARTPAPLGFCHTRMVYIWKTPQTCNKFQGSGEKAQ